MPLTDREIRNAKPDAKPYKLADSGGMYLEIAPSGGKWWRLKYRIGGKEKRLSLGVYPDVPLSDARERRDAARRIVAAGKGPSAERQRAKRDAEGIARNTFEAVAREWYAKQSNVWVARHAADVLRRLESNLFTEIGHMPIASVT